MGGQYYGLRLSTIQAPNTASWYYFVFNLQGDVIGLLDSTGAVIARYEYDAWGKILSVKNAAGQAITDPTHVANINPIRYRGYYYDSETGFYYLKSRYYDPVTGRFLNADGMVDTGQGLIGTNMFAYCENTPVMYCNPTGKSKIYIIESDWIYYSLYSDPNKRLKDTMYYMGSEVSVACQSRSGIPYYIPPTTPPLADGRGNNNKGPRKDSRKGSKNRQKTGARERNQGHPNGEEHSVKPKGNKVPGRKSNPRLEVAPEFNYEKFREENTIPPMPDLIVNPPTGEEDIIGQIIIFFEQLFEDE